MADKKPQAIRESPWWSARQKAEAVMGLIRGENL